jgi:curli biogenesis system outer membrane secretion channel CsgG
LKKKLLFVVFLLILVQLLSLPSIMAERQIKIAVLPFDDGSIQERWWGGYNLGKGVSDELITALLETKRFRLIEREQVTKILDEQKFGATGLTDVKSAAEIGKILGVQFLVMGRVTEFTNNTQNTAFGTNNQNAFGLAISVATARAVIDARLVDTSSAEIIASVTGEGEKKNTSLGLATNNGAIAFGSSQFQQTNLGKALRDAVNSVSSKLATKVYEGSSIDLTVSGLVAYASPKGERIVINLGTKDGIEPGMVFTVSHIIEEIKDPKTGEIIDEVSEPIADITVTEVKEKSASCNLTTLLNQTISIAISDKVKSKNIPAPTPIPTSVPTAVNTPGSAPQATNTPQPDPQPTPEKKKKGVW